MFDKLPRQIVLQTRRQEVSVLFAALAALLAIAAIGLSLLWSRWP